MMDNLGDDELAALGDADLGLLSHPRELALANRLAAFPEVIVSAAADLAPHAVAFYLRDLAADFHAWYNAERVLVDDLALRRARLALAAATRQVIRNGMTLLGVSCPATM
jgi:arginyl-tRNA synthetase